MADTSDWLIRLGLTNFDANVLNTQDLSTIRGASMAADAGAHMAAAALLDVAGKAGVTATMEFAGSSEAELLVRGVTEDQLALLCGTEDQLALLCGTVRDVLKQGNPAMPDEPTYHTSSYTSGGAHYIRPPTQCVTFQIAFAEIESAGINGARSEALKKLKRQALRAPSIADVEGGHARSSNFQDRASMRCPIDPMRVVGDDRPMGGAWISTRTEQILSPPGGKATRDRTARGKNSERVLLSSRVAHLRAFGRSARSQLYARMVGKARWRALQAKGLLPKAGTSASFDLCQSFEQIVQAAPGYLRPSVKGKLAYIYLDGNGWGELIRKLSGEGLTALFNEACHDVTQNLFGGLLEHCVDGALAHFAARGFESAPYSVSDEIHIPNWQAGVDRGQLEERQLLRLETLMVGGEDILIVCPSWLAFEVVSKAFEVVQDAEIRQQAKNGWPDDETGKRHLSMRAGVLICDHGMPVRRAKALVSDGLCEALKKGEKGSIKENTAQFHVLESLDVPERGSPAGEIADERLRLFGEDDPLAFAVTGATMQELRQNLKELRDLQDGLPRSQLYRHLIMLRNGLPESDVETSLERALGFRNRTLAWLKERLPGAKEASLGFRLKLLAEWWDYAWPFDQDVRQDQAQDVAVTEG